jgi:hypothetical protein
MLRPHGVRAIAHDRFLKWLVASQSGLAMSRKDCLMPAIGYVTPNANGFKGQLRTVSIRTEIEIIPNRSKTSDAQPDYRVFASGADYA